MELKKVIETDLQNFNFQKKNLIECMKKHNELVSSNLLDENPSDLHLYASIIGLEKALKEYAFIQGKISSVETVLIQIDE